MNIRLAMRIAMEIAKQSSARRKKVGCVIITPSGRIATGVNHNPEGVEYPCDYFKGRDLVTLESVVHAEIDAIRNALNKNLSIYGSNLVTTYSPCLPCAEAITRHGFRDVIYLELYHNPTGLMHLEQNKILHRSYNDLSCNENHGCNRRSNSS